MTPAKVSILEAERVVMRGPAPSIIIAPSILSADFARLGEEVRAVDAAGADHLLVQAEPGSTIHLHRVLAKIRALGKKAGVVLDPATPPELVEYVLHLCDVILVMTVNPGFGGQTFIPEMLPKIMRLRAICAERGLHPVIEVDGGENTTTAAQAAAAGATAIVAGSAIFGTEDYAKAIADIRASAAAAAVTS